MTVISNDKDIFVCVKPSGILSQRSEGGDGTTVQDLYPDELLYPVHRLDRETSGVMVFAKNPKAAAELSRQITDGGFSKNYYAVVKGCPDEKQGIYEDLLFRDKRRNKSFVVDRERKGVRKASLEYTVLAENEGLSLVRIKLHTGRTHQIRVQFSSRKMPLYGDGRYGGGKGELGLFAYRLEFSHPATGEKLCFSALPDTEKEPWSFFGKETLE